MTKTLIGSLETGMVGQEHLNFICLSRLQRKLDADDTTTSAKQKGVRVPGRLNWLTNAPRQDDYAPPIKA